MTSSAKRPFRFYGREPAEFVEGANDGHFFTVQFQRTPTDAELKHLAAIYERRMSGGPALAKEIKSL